MPTYKEIITDAKDRMSKTREAFKREMQSMRAGRANPQILDRITVDYYGVQTPLTQMGNITAPEPRMLVINLWDQKSIPPIPPAGMAGPASFLGLSAIIASVVISRPATEAAS